MPTTNPLELPEVLFRVGYFLLLWVCRTDPLRGNLLTLFDPTTFRSCLLVSKLWYQTLLPILWCAYYSYNMTNIPSSVISKNSPHFRIFSSACDHLGPKGSHMTLAEQRRLVMANKDLRDLYWYGPNKIELLEPEDFVRLRSLAVLTILHWDGSGGRVSTILRAVAGTLRELNMHIVNGIQFSDVSAPSLQGIDDDVVGNGRGDQVQNHPGPLVLPFLETFTMHHHHGSPGVIELLDCCPNLKSLQIISNLSEGFRRIYGPRVKDGRLEVLEIEVMSLNEDLASVIMLHAGTLKSLGIKTIRRVWSIGGVGGGGGGGGGGSESVDLGAMLWLLVECTKLERFSLDTHIDISFQSWGFTGLEQLAIKFRVYTDNQTRSVQLKEEEQEDIESGPFISSEVSFMGWYLLSQTTEYLGQVAINVDKDTLSKVFALVQGMENLETLTWDNIAIYRMVRKKGTRPFMADITFGDSGG
ncbi:hypothetical protein BGX29_000963 [Mortierella sp. GBA35]|nr:hypothetical protein BGX29_000963 [Mortierella sp. GBA35]